MVILTPVIDVPTARIILQLALNLLIWKTACKSPSRMLFVKGLALYTERHLSQSE